MTIYNYANNESIDYFKDNFAGGVFEGIECVWIAK